ncbi:MAG: DUF4153 domain-containing protein [Clostridiales bacterium]|nr:DUF4153 domain-containing protein [Clostridiales bacterium]
MKIRIATLFKTLMTKLSSSLKRFPETIILATLTVSVLVYVNHMHGYMTVSQAEALQRVSMALALGIPVALCISTLFERIAPPKALSKALAYTGTVAGLALYYIFFLKDFEMVTMTRYIALNVALYLVFTFIPYFYKRENYELYVIKLFTSFFVAYLYSAVLFLGLAAMLFTVDALFALEVSEKLYFDIWLVVAGIFAPAYFLADIPQHREEVHLDYFPKVLKVLLLYILMPLLIAYSAILYVYFAKIVITRQWPDGMVSHLVLWYSFISILVLFFVYQIRRANQWVGIFVRYFPRLIIPLLAMMFVSMGIRINAYGITENRYFVLATGLWVTGGFIYHMLKKNVRSSLLPVSLALVAVLAVTGPWSAYGISRMSQNRRFERILMEYDMIRNGGIVKPAGDLADEDKREISAIIRYFNSYHSLDDLKYLPEGFTAENMEELFGFEYNHGRWQSNGRDYFYYHMAENENLLDIGDFDYFADFSVYGQSGLVDGEGPLSVSYLYESGEFKILKEGQEIYTAILPNIASELCGALDEDTELTADEMSYQDEREGLEVLYVFKNINGWKDTLSGRLEMESADFYVFIKLT